MRDDLDDPIDDLLGRGPVPAAARPAPPASYKPADFTEPCQKCGGTGRFRDLGPCFACQGRGKKTFKTAPEKRAKARAAAAGKLEAAIEAWKAEHPAAYAWLLARTDRFEFATSCWNGLRKYGALTDNQLAAVERLMARDVERDAKRAVEREQRAAAAPVVEVSAIEVAFAKAREAGLQWPKLRLARFELSPAGANSKNPGAIYCKDGADYLGKVIAGRFLASRDCGEEREKAVIETLRDPKAAAVAYGKSFGKCSCCGRQLTDPASIEAGIGPICAGKFGW